MHVFPAIEAEGQHWHLPLASHVALGLSQAWISEDADELQRWVMLDPPLAIWLTHVFGGDEVDDLGQLMGRAAPAMPGRWLEGQPEESFAPHPSRRWPKLVEETLAVASLAAVKATEMAHAGAAVSVGRAYWLGMLIESAAWLSVSGPAVRQADLARVLHGYGTRLIGELAAARQGKKSTTESACVGAARREYRRTGLAAFGEADRSGALLADVQETVGLWDAEAHPQPSAARNAVMATWGPGSPAATRVLRQLAQRLSRLRALETQWSQRLRQAKLAAMAELAYGAGHEINNPLANVVSRAQTLQRDESDADRRRQLATIESQAYRAYEMIADMMFFAKPPTPVLQPIRCQQLVDGVKPSLEAAAAERSSRIEWARKGDDQTVYVDAAQVQMALRCVVMNALEAAEQDGQVRITVECNEGALLVRVDDNGPGLTERSREHLFDPFYSGREAGRGLGLGLSKAWAVAQGHGGRLEVVPSDLGGAAFEIELPSRVTQRETEDTAAVAQE